MNNDLRIFAATLRRNLPTLDLHTVKPLEALDKLELFLFHCIEKKEVEAKVIYGIGSGKLSSQVIHYLRNHSLVDRIVEENGSCIIFFK